MSVSRTDFDWVEVHFGSQEQNWQLLLGCRNPPLKSLPDFVVIHRNYSWILDDSILVTDRNWPEAGLPDRGTKTCAPQDQS
jgi:hypothetical protein